MAWAPATSNSLHAAGAAPPRACLRALRRRTTPCLPACCWHLAERLSLGKPHGACPSTHGLLSHLSFYHPLASLLHSHLPPTHPLPRHTVASHPCNANPRHLPPLPRPRAPRFAPRCPTASCSLPSHAGASTYMPACSGQRLGRQVWQDRQDPHASR